MSVVKSAPFALRACAASMVIITAHAGANPTGALLVSGQASFQTQGTGTSTPGPVINWQSFSIGANPTGPSVVNGQATIQTQPNLLTVTNSPGAIIHWQSFSIGANETTRFNQQSATSTVLNRVVGGDVSSILGTLTSNGKVFLVNPNGILFGSGSRIDTAAFTATTGNLSDADFLAGRYDVPGQSAFLSVANGVITVTGSLSGNAMELSGAISGDATTSVTAKANTITWDTVTPPAGSINITGDHIADTCGGCGSSSLIGGLISRSGPITVDAGSIINLGTSNQNNNTVTSNLVTNGSISLTGGSISLPGSSISVVGTTKPSGSITLQASQQQSGSTISVADTGKPSGSITLQASQQPSGTTVPPSAAVSVPATTVGSSAGAITIGRTGSTGTSSVGSTTAVAPQSTLGRLAGTTFVASIAVAPGPSAGTLLTPTSGTVQRATLTVAAPPTTLSRAAPVLSTISLQKREPLF